MAMDQNPGTDGCSHQYTVEIYGYSSRETYGIIVFDSFPFNFEVLCNIGATIIPMDQTW